MSSDLHVGALSVQGFTAITGAAKYLINTPETTTYKEESTAEGFLEISVISDSGRPANVTIRVVKDGVALTTVTVSADGHGKNSQLLPVLKGVTLHIESNVGDGGRARAQWFPVSGKV